MSSATSNRLDYEQKYPKDRFGEELGPNARVWFTYLDEADAYDRNKVGGWKDTLDVLLVFTGLFSAVVTTFLSQSSQSLQQDFTQVSASLLFEMVQLQRAHLTGTSIGDIPNSTLTPNSPFNPSTNASLVNGLWFASLTLSLCTALFSVLAKQWLCYYMSTVSGTAREKARVRHFRFQGLEKWKVGFIIDLLPIFLHLALGLFLLGLIIMVLPLNIRIAWTVITLSGVTYALYLASVALPIWYAECPYTTSLRTFMDAGCHVVSSLVAPYRRKLRYKYPSITKFWSVASHQLSSLKRVVVRHATRFTSGFANAVQHYLLGSEERFKQYAQALWGALPREMELEESIRKTDRLDLKALHWLHSFSTNPSVQRIIARCVGIYPEPIKDSGVKFPLMELADSLHPGEKDVEDHCHILSLQTQDGSLATTTLGVLANASVNKAEEPYGCIMTARKMLEGDYVRILREVFEDPHSHSPAPLSVWNGLLSVAKPDAVLAGYILCSPCLNPFSWRNWSEFGRFNDWTVEDGSVYDKSALIRFSDSTTSKKLNKPCFRYLSRCFCGEELSTDEDVFFVARHRLFLAIYHNLTSDQPFITDQKRLQECLESLFGNLSAVIPPKTAEIAERIISGESSNRFSRDILCSDVFWGDRMTGQARNAALKVFDILWECDVKNTGDILHFFSANYRELQFIYQQCSEERFEVDYLDFPSLFLPLFVPQNIKDLTAIICDGPPEQAVNRFRRCFRYLRRSHMMVKSMTMHRRCVFPHLVHLFKTLPRVDPLFLIFRDKAILIDLWACLTECMVNAVLEDFFDILKLEFDSQGMKELYELMVTEALSEAYKLRLFKSAYRFGRRIGIPASEFNSSVEKQFGGGDSPSGLKHRFQSASEMVKAFEKEFDEEKRKHSRIFSNLFTRRRGISQKPNSSAQKPSYGVTGV